MVWRYVNEFSVRFILYLLYLFVILPKSLEWDVQRERPSLLSF